MAKRKRTKKNKETPNWVHVSAFLVFVVSLAISISELPLEVDTFYAAGYLSVSATLGIAVWFGLRALSRGI